MVCVGKGKLLQLCKFRLADLSAHALAAPGREHGGTLSKHQGYQGKKHHLQPLHQNIAPVAVCNPHVHDGRHHKGDDKFKHSLQLDAQDCQTGLLFVRPQIL